MKDSTCELIKTERRRDTFGFITEIIQRGKLKPKKYKHYISMSAFLYEDLTGHGVINPESYFIDQSAFFEFDGKDMTISFISLYQCEDLQRKIDHYLVVKFAGSYPIKRGGSFF